MLKAKPNRRVIGVAIVAMVAALVLPMAGDGGRVDAGGPPDPPVPPVPGDAFQGCGIIHVTESPGGPGEFCVAIDTHSGGIITISDPGGFGDGDPVCITGVVAACSAQQLLCGSSQGCVTVGTIVSSQTPLGSVTGAVSECGTFQRLSAADATCVLFVADSGSTYSIIGNSVDPLDLVGQRLRVSGEIMLDGCMSPCGPVQGCLLNPKIDHCVAPGVTGDLNGDRLVNALDLGILFSNWSIPAAAPGCAGRTPCASDLNADGLVNSLDLGVLLSHWG